MACVIYNAGSATLSSITRAHGVMIENSKYGWLDSRCLASVWFWGLAVARQSVSVHFTSLSEHKLIPRVLETFDWPTAIGFRFLQRFVSPGECWTSCCVYTGRTTMAMSIFQSFGD